MSEDLNTEAQDNSEIQNTDTVSQSVDTYDPFAVPEDYDPNAVEKQKYMYEPPREPFFKRYPQLTNFVALLIAFVAAGAFVYLPHYFHRSRGADYPTIGFPSPVFQIEPLSENKDLKPFTSFNLVGKTTLLHLWGPWCGPCCQELPNMKALESKYSQLGNFQFISVAFPPNLVVGPNAEKTLDGKMMLQINPEIKNEQMTFCRQATDIAVSAGFTGKELYWDPNGSLTNALFQSFPVGKQEMLSFPTTFLFDSKKTIRAVWVGYAPGLENQIEQKIQEINNEESK